VDGAAAESVLVDELRIDARVVRQCGVAPTDDLVDQPGDESLCCEVRTTDQQTPTGGSSSSFAFPAGPGLTPTRGGRFRLLERAAGLVADGRSSGGE
jgi:hypothetical protein